MGQSGAKSDPARNAIIINNNDTCNEERNKEKIEYDTYIFCEYLAVVPWPVEEKVAVAIDFVSGSNHAIHIEWPVQIFAFHLNFEGVYLQAALSGCNTDHERDAFGCPVCIVHGTQCGYSNKLSQALETTNILSLQGRNLLQT
jgi:hypothetical protein